MKLFYMKLTQIALLLFFLMISPIKADTLYYAPLQDGWGPFWVINQKQKTHNGIFADVLDEISRITDYKFVNYGYLPPKRIRRLFENGDVQIECCISPTWRASVKEIDTQLWTDPVLRTQEVLIFPKNLAFPFHQPSDLKGKTIGTILGYGYHLENIFIRYDVPKPMNLVKLVAKNRLPAAILNLQETLYLMRDNPLREKIEISENYFSDLSLHMRVHRKNSYMIGPLNQAIRQIIDQGTLDKIVNRYLTQKSAPHTPK